MNEIAHRLALNALRQVSFGTQASVVAAVAAGIASELEDQAIPVLRPRWLVTADEVRGEAGRLHATG